ncbi:glycosyltransferase family 4 protein [Flavobacterium nackdongense]|uniref:Glycosyltransferase n=1 Tax=Flavobacterium nackdongense TaxID=2547394 RepID=A0A4P6YH23_9FLAO|nr:glycosyltransferase family 4 protein [Flavobacterium nackdongense]QBN19880.1 glycosyltransferase [Flavobacterium nackdongense]
MTKPKKIAVVCNYALNPNRIGGMDRFWVAYDQKAKALGYEIDWYFSDYTPFEFFSELTIYSANSDNMESFFLEKVKQDSLKYDILVTHFLGLCSSFFKKAKATGIQQIIAVDHNPRPLEGFPLAKIIKNKIKGILYSSYIDQFIGVSNYAKKHILKDYGFFLDKKISVIYNGIDTSVFVKRTQENRNKFILTSHLRESKGIQDLLRALSIVEKPILSQIQIDMYGEGPYEDELRRLTAEFDLATIINFKGSSSKLNELYADYAYLIQPSHGETFCYSVIESLACNVPVITTVEAGNVLSVIKEDHNGFLFNAGNYNQLAAILKNIVLGNLKIEKDVSMPIEKEFNLEKMVNEHIQLLH